MNIHFVGYLQTFIRQEYELLKQEYTVTAFDLMNHALSFRQIPGYLVDSFGEWKHVRNADLVWIWVADYPAIPFMILAKIFRKPVVVTISGFEVVGYKEIGYGNQLQAIRGATSRWIIRNATVTIAQSNAYREIVKELVPTANTGVINGWIDTNLCDDPLPEKHGVVTTVAKYKNSDLVKNLPLFLEATKDMETNVLGGISYDLYIAKLKAAKVYCQLSITDQFPLSLLEAMACGCIPVVSDRGGMPEIIGNTGYVVPYGDLERTKLAISWALLFSNQLDRDLVRERARLFSIERRNNAVRMMVEGLHDKQHND
jgi:glycosyltransferase involved in cell wall biosynthesis